MKRKSPLPNVTRRMPELIHSVPSLPFDVMQSDVCDWLMKQPEIRRWVFDIVRGRKLIVFNPERGTWKGTKAK